MMAVFGEIVLVALGLVIFLWSTFVAYFVSKLQHVGFVFVLPMCFGLLVMWVGIHYGPITLSTGG